MNPWYLLALWPFGLLLVWALVAAAKRGDEMTREALEGSARIDWWLHRDRWPASALIHARCALRWRLEHAIQLDSAARLYRFVSGHATVADHRVTRAEELAGLVYGATFDEFLERNRLVAYEAVLR